MRAGSAGGCPCQGPGYAPASKLRRPWAPGQDAKCALVSNFKTLKSIHTRKACGIAWEAVQGNCGRPPTREAGQTLYPSAPSSCTSRAAPIPSADRWPWLANRQTGSAALSLFQALIRHVYLHWQPEAACTHRGAGASAGWPHPGDQGRQRRSPRTHPHPLHQERPRQMAVEHTHMQDQTWHQRHQLLADMCTQDCHDGCCAQNSAPPNVQSEART